VSGRPPGNESVARLLDRVTASKSGTISTAPIVVA
jgi:hypothetical protein